MTRRAQRTSAHSACLDADAHKEFGVQVIGVAKTGFATATHAIPVPRGQATKPLFVLAAALVQSMSGRHRLPDVLCRADSFARDR